MQSARQRKRMIGTDDHNLIQHALRVIRHRRIVADMQSTLAYNLDKATGFNRPVPVETITESTDCREPWSHTHNSSLDAIDARKPAMWRLKRRLQIKLRQKTRRLELAIARYHRRNATPQQSPVETNCKYPMPAIRLAGDDTTEMELKTLLATIRNDERRADVAAECWVVRCENPSVPALHVFNRALKSCQLAARGLYSTTEYMRQREKPGDKRTAQWYSGQYYHPETERSVRYWQESLESLNKAEREQLAIAFAKSKLNDDTLLNHLLDGRTPAEICQTMGISTATYYRRLQAIQPAHPVEWSTGSVRVRIDN